MKEVRELSPQYVTDDGGHRTAVILPIEDYEALLEDLEDLAVLADRRDEESVAHQDVVDELRRDGCL